MKDDRFDIFSSLMMAIVTILSAVTAWRVTVAGTQAGDAAFDGISAAIQAQESRIVIAIQSYQHYQGYTSYFRYNEQGNILWEEGDPATERQQSDLWGVALGLRYSFFPPQYLDEEGKYDIEREMDEQWADAAQTEDLDPEPHFERAESFRGKSSLLIGTVILFALSFFFFTLGQALQNWLRYVAALAGLGMMGFAIVFLILLEWVLV